MLCIRHPFILSLASLVLLVGCAGIVPNGMHASSNSSIKSIAIVNACDHMVRFHQGITVFDNVFRHQPSPELDAHLLGALSRELGTRFHLPKVSVPPEYTAKGKGFFNTLPPLPPVAGVDAIAVIRPLVTGTSEPAIAKQGYGISTARLGGGAMTFCNIKIVCYDAKTTKEIATIFIEESQPVLGISWKSEWQEYLPQQQQQILSALKATFDAATVKAATRFSR